MCGIAGKIYFDKQRKVTLNELKSMTDVIMHRGPDDEGHYLNNNVGLGFRRLSIIDLKTGHQPLANFDDTLWITFNGEVYNFKEERKKLEKRGYKFKTNTDTEVIVNLYQEYGENCVEQRSSRASYGASTRYQRPGWTGGSRPRGAAEG